MVRHTQHKLERDIEKSLGSKRTLSYAFLGIGIALFFMNISTMLGYMPKSYSSTAFNISVFSSMIIILFSLYILHYDS